MDNFVLCKPNRKTLCVLNGVQLESVSYTPKFNDLDEITFTVDKYIIDDDGNKIVSQGYEQLHAFMEVYLNGIGYFQIKEPTISNDGKRETKTVTGTSIACELVQKDLVGFTVNKTTANSLEMLADNNVNSLGYPNEYITFYNPSNTQLSLIDLALEKAVGWKVGFIDDFLKNQRFVFDNINENIFSFLTKTLSSTARCIFCFDTVNKTVSAYAENHIGEDTGIIIAYRNLLNKVDITCNDDNIFTRLNVQGKDSLTFADINYGDTHVLNLDYYKNTNYMDSELIAKLDTWEQARNDNRENYISKVKTYYSYVEQISEIDNKVPTNGVLNNWDNMSMDELTKNQTYYNSLIKSFQITAQNTNPREGETVYTGNLDDYSPSRLKSDGTIDHEAYMADLDGQGKETYREIITYVLPNIQIAIDNFDKTAAEKSDYFTGYLTEWGLYGIVELKAKQSSYEDQLNTLKDYAKPWNSLTDEEKAAHGGNQTNYTLYHDEYVKIDEYLANIKLTLENLTLTKELLVTSRDTIQTELKQIRTDMAITGGRVVDGAYTSWFTEDEIELINLLFHDTDYTNENILTTSLDDFNSKLEIERELYDDAVSELEALSVPQYSFSCELDNLLDIEEFKEWQDDFKIGNFITLETTPNCFTKLRLISITHNPCIKSNNLTVEFSNMVTTKSGRNDFSYIFDKAISVAKNSITYSNNQNKDSIELSTELLNLLSGSSVFQGKFDNLQLKNISANEAQIVKLTADYAKINELDLKYAAIDFANITDATIENLNAKNGAFQSLSSDIGKIDTLIFGSASGDVIQTSFANAVIAQLGNAQITSAMIAEIDAGKITSGSIYTNKVRIYGDENNLLSIIDNTIAISDGTHTRVQIGKDANNDYSMYVWDASGKLMFDALGLTENGITRQIIRNDTIKDDANISASKLNINSLFSVINEDDSHTLKSTKIYLDDEEQTLQVAFTGLTKKVTEQGDTISSQGTSIETIQGKITSKIWQQDITDATSPLGKDLEALSTKYSEVVQDLSGFKTTVGETYTTKEDFEGLEIGGRNLVLATATPLSLKNDGSGTKTSYSYRYKDVETAESLDETTVTISFDYTNEISSGSCVLNVYWNWHNIIGFNTFNTGSGHYVKTIQLSDATHSGTHAVYLQGNFTGTVTISNFKLEKGNKATDWTPAPEDLETSITAVKTIATQNVDKFNWLVKSGTSATDFTLTDRTATLISDYINLNGLVTFSGLGSEAQNKINAAQSTANTANSTANTALTNTNLQSDVTNYSQLNDSTASYWGFTADTTADGHWYTMNTLARDKFISNYHQCKGGERFKISFQISTSCRGSSSQGGTNSVYRGTTIGLYSYNSEATSVGIVYSGRVTGTSDAPETNVSSVVTLPSSARRFRVFVQTDGWSNWSGTIKIRNVRVEKIDDEAAKTATNWGYTTDKTLIDGGKIYTGTVTAEKIAAKAITAEKIATDAIKSTNYVANTSGSFLNLADGSFDSKYLKWDETGVLSATNADISGKITASSGTIGDFTIDGSLIGKPNSDGEYIDISSSQITYYAKDSRGSGRMCLTIIDGGNISTSFQEQKAGDYRTLITPSLFGVYKYNGTNINSNISVMDENGISTTGTITASTFEGNLNGTATNSNCLYMPRVVQADVNWLPDTGERTMMREFSSDSANLPNANWYHILANRSADTRFGSQLAIGMTTDDLYYRAYYAGNFSTWKRAGIDVVIGTSATNLSYRSEFTKAVVEFWKTIVGSSSRTIYDSTIITGLSSSMTAVNPSPISNGPDFAFVVGNTSSGQINVSGNFTKFKVTYFN